MTANDALDADAGPTASRTIRSSPRRCRSRPRARTILGTLDSTPSTTYDLDFFANPACSAVPRLHEGLTYLGSTTVTTDGAGHADFDVTLAYTIEADQP